MLEVAFPSLEEHKRVFCHSHCYVIHHKLLPMTYALATTYVMQRCSRAITFLESSFHNQWHCQFPNIVNFQLRGGVNKLEAIGLGSDDSTLQVRSLYIKCNKEIQLPSKWLVQLYYLEKLELLRM